MLEKNSAGENVDSYCGKCKRGREHTIVTMDGEAVGKVRCQDCGSMHNFSDPLVAQKTRKHGVNKGHGTSARPAAQTVSATADSP